MTRKMEKKYDLFFHEIIFDARGSWQSDHSRSPTHRFSLFLQGAAGGRAPVLRLGYRPAGSRQLCDQWFSQSAGKRRVAVLAQGAAAGGAGTGPGHEAAMGTYPAKALDNGRLLIISPFTEKTRRASADTAAVRNDMMIQLAGQVVVGYADPAGMLVRRLRLERDKAIVYL